MTGIGNLETTPNRLYKTRMIVVLMNRLLTDGRNEELHLIASDKRIREKLLKEYGI